MLAFSAHLEDENIDKSNDELMHVLVERSHEYSIVIDAALMGWELFFIMIRDVRIIQHMICIL
jgi:hypothetical protein